MKYKIEKAFKPNFETQFTFKKGILKAEATLNLAALFKDLADQTEDIQWDDLAAAGITTLLEKFELEYGIPKGSSEASD